MKPVQLDMAILTPVDPPEASFEHLTASVHAPELGEELYFGGYSDEVEVPFGLDRLIDPSMKGMDEFRREYDFDVRRLMSGPMIKRGIVGNVISIWGLL